jgi:hypothetical protein
MVDRYTKSVLTIIAVCLAIIAFRLSDPIGRAEAESGPIHVIVDSAKKNAFQVAGPLQITIREQQ